MISEELEILNGFGKLPRAEQAQISRREYWKAYRENIMRDKRPIWLKKGQECVNKSLYEEYEAFVDKSINGDNYGGEALTFFELMEANERNASFEEFCNIFKQDDIEQIKRYLEMAKKFLKKSLVFDEDALLEYIRKSRVQGDDVR